MVPLSPVLGDREFDKFVEEDGQTKVNVKANFSGTIRPSGLNVGFRITTMEIGDTATAIPTSPFSQRNSLSVVNLSDNDVLYIGNSDVTADRVLGTTSGWEVNPAESFNVDITDSIILYGIAPTGKTITVKVIEIA